MKRALLIATGTVGGLGAVMMITPPQLEGNGALLAGASATTSDPVGNASQNNSAGATTDSSAGSSNSSKQSANTKSSSNSAKSSRTNSSTSTNTKSNSKTSTSNTNTNSNTASNNNSSNSNSNNASTNANANPEPVQAAPAGVTGNFTGDSVNVGYGNVQVRITVSNGKITDATALQAPSGRSQRFTDYSVPNLRSQTLQVQSAAINGVSGASYTSYGWYKSLISALQKAGMPTGV